MLQLHWMPDNLCIISLPTSYNQNMTVHFQPEGWNHAEIWELKAPQLLLPLWPGQARPVVYQPLPAHSTAAQQDSSNCLQGWSLPPQGERKKERHRSTITTLTYSKQSHLISKLKVIIPQERAIMLRSFFFFNLWIAMSWQAIRLKHLNSMWRIYGPFWDLISLR